MSRKITKDDDRRGRPTPLERLRAFTVESPDACWEWKGAKCSSGYGNFFLKGRWLGAHRASYLLRVGPIPDGLTIDHLCRNTGCVNPGHMELVSHAVNVLRGTGPSARNARATHCKRGHPLTGDNLYVYPSGRMRACRLCHRDYERARRRSMRFALMAADEVAR